MRRPIASVGRLGRLLDLVGLLCFVAGAGVFVRAWLGFVEVRDSTPGLDDAPMAAVRFADGFLRLQRIGVALMLLGVAVFFVAWWTARRDSSANDPGGTE